MTLRGCGPWSGGCARPGYPRSGSNAPTRARAGLRRWQLRRAAGARTDPAGVSTGETVSAPLRRVGLDHHIRRPNEPTRWAEITRLATGGDEVSVRPGQESLIVGAEARRLLVADRSQAGSGTPPGSPPGSSGVASIGGGGSGSGASVSSSAGSSGTGSSGLMIGSGSGGGSLMPRVNQHIPMAEQIQTA